MRQLPAKSRDAKDQALEEYQRSHLARKSAPRTVYARSADEDLLLRRVGRQSRKGAQVERARSNRIGCLESAQIDSVESEGRGFLTLESSSKIPER